MSKPKKWKTICTINTELSRTVMRTDGTRYSVKLGAPHHDIPDATWPFIRAERKSDIIAELRNLADRLEKI